MGLIVGSFDFVFLSRCTPRHEDQRGKKCQAHRAGSNEPASVCSSSASREVSLTGCNGCSDPLFQPCPDKCRNLHLSTGKALMPKRAQESSTLVRFGIVLTMFLVPTTLGPSPAYGISDRLCGKETVSARRVVQTSAEPSRAYDQEEVHSSGLALVATESGYAREAKLTGLEKFVQRRQNGCAQCVRCLATDVRNS